MSDPVNDLVETVSREPGASRRRLLRLAGAAATGAAASMAMRSPAGAADGDPITLGQTTTATTSTRADFTGNGTGQAFLFQAGATYGVNSGIVSAALAGWTTKAAQPHGIYGYTEVAGGSGVQGRSNGANTHGVFGNAVGSGGIGVEGRANSASGYGMKATNTDGIGVKAEGTTTGLRADSSGAGSTAVVGVAPATGTGVAGEGLVGVQGVAFGVDGVGVEAGLPVTGTGLKARGTTAVDAESLAENGIAVFGRAPDGEAARFEGAVGVAIQAGDGVQVNATRVAARLFSPHAALQLGGGVSPVAGPFAHHEAGQIAVDNFNTIWYCTNAGFPGSWRTLCGSGAAGAYYPITPTRVYDSRKPTPAPLVSGAHRTISVADGIDATGAVVTVNAVPILASAITYNITVVDTVARGFLSVVPGVVGSTASSTINWSAWGSIVANGTTVGLSGSRQITVSCGGSGASTNFIVDITGYYR